MKIKYYIVLAAATLSLSSCFKLDQEPYVELSQKNSFQSVRDAQFWVNGMYSSLRSNFHGIAMYATDIQADYLQSVRSFSQNEDLDNLYNWSLLNSSNATIASLWRKHFEAIQNINIALDGIVTIPTSTTADKQKITHNMGELYLARAIYYTYLVTHYAPSYNETSPYGLPLLDHFIDGEFPLRSSVKETYDFILADINRAQERLSDEEGSPGKDTFSKDAVTALKARVLLYKGDWAGAYQAATSLIAAGTYPLISPSETALKNMWDTDGPAESITQLYARYSNGNDGELPQGNTIYLGEDKSIFGDEYYPNFAPTQDFVNLFESNDLRKKVYIKELYINYGSSTRFDNIYLVAKYPDNDQLKNSPYDNGTFLHRPKIFRIAEQYLIAAEAAYRNADETNARLYLNRLRRSRGLTTEVTATADALFREIQNERNRELSFEGFRLTDIKRWNLAVVRGTPQNLDAIVTTDPTNGYQLNVPAGNYKLVWPIPPTNIRYENGRWKQNPGW